MCDVQYDQTVKTTTITKTNSFFDDSDLTIPYRLVGSYEYARAVQRFEQLIELSTADEIQVYDELLDQQPQLTFYAGMFMEPEVTKSLDLTADSGLAEFKERFRRSGIAWMLALAKMELGATVSAYGDQRLKRPFGVFGPGRIDAEPFLFILADDLQAHVVNLAQDKKIAKTLKGVGRIDSWTLAYLRRMNLLDDMVTALRSANNQLFNRRIKPVARKIQEGKFALESLILSDRKTATFGSTSTKRSRGKVQTSVVDRECDDLDHDQPAADGDRQE